MKTRKLGRTRQPIPAIGLGTMGIGGYSTKDASKDDEAVNLLRKGIDLGMTFIDTAEGYGAGHSEEVVGRAIRGFRNQVVIATKFSPENSTFHEVLGAARRSMERLGVDCIDLYQAHWPNPRVPIQETIKALSRLVQEGAVRYVGLSNCSVREMKLAESCLPRDSLVSMQQEYSLLERTVELQSLPFCRHRGYTLIAYSPLAQGMIGGEDRRGTGLSEMARHYGVTVAQLVLRWLTHDECVTVIPKASNLAHMEENSAASDFSISKRDYDRIAELYKMDIRRIPTDLIRVADDAGRSVYRSLKEAIENRYHIVPSPVELSEQILAGEMLKPIKVRQVNDPSGRDSYQLIDGRTRYWAWVIAHEGQQPIPAIVQ